MQKHFCCRHLLNVFFKYTLTFREKKKRELYQEIYFFCLKSTLNGRNHRKNSWPFCPPRTNKWNISFYVSLEVVKPCSFQSCLLTIAAFSVFPNSLQRSRPGTLHNYSHWKIAWWLCQIYWLGFAGEGWESLCYSCRVSHQVAGSQGGIIGSVKAGLGFTTNLVAG